MTGTELTVCCQCLPIHDAEYPAGDERTPTAAVLDAISRATERDVMDLRPLYYVIDPDRLDRVFNDADAESVLGFTYDEWNVFVRGDGRIRVCDATEHVEAAPVFERPIQ